MSKLIVITGPDHVALMHSLDGGYSLTAAQARDLAGKLLAAANAVDGPPVMRGIEVTEFVPSGQDGGK